MTSAPLITIAVEGDLDERVATRLVEEAGGAIALIHGKRGKDWLRRQMGGYQNAARRARWFILVDLDRDRCPPSLRTDWRIDESVGSLCFRVAVPSTESWLLADRSRLANFLQIARSHLPVDPDRVRDAKRALMEAADHSRSRIIREAIVPRGTARTGPLYNPTLTQFVDEHWNPAAAAAASPSLARCRTRLTELVAAATPA